MKRPTTKVILLGLLLTSAGYSAQLVVSDSRETKEKMPGPGLTLAPDLVITDGGMIDRFKPETMLQFPEPTTARIVLNHVSGHGATQTTQPFCVARDEAIYRDATGTYILRCKLLVKYSDSSDFEDWSFVNRYRNILAMALDVTLTHNNVPIKIEWGGVPPQLSDAFRVQTYDNGSTPHSTYYEYDVQFATGTTTLELSINDSVDAEGTDIVIPYQWGVKGVYRYPVYSRMYMEQIDSNLELTYIQPSGASGGVIEPNTKVDVMSKSNATSGYGEIHLKLNKKTGFGPRSSKLRVTVECQ